MFYNLIQHNIKKTYNMNLHQFKNEILQIIKNRIRRMTTKQQELDSMLKQEQKRELSSEEQQNRDEVVSRSQFRKPIKNPFSDQSDNSDSDRQGITNNNNTGTPFIQKPPLPTKTALQQAQDEMKWDKTQQLETQILTRLEGQGMKDKKIKELASKYKTLNIAYEKEKTLRKNLQNQLNSLMKTPQELNKSSVSKKEKVSLQKTTTNLSCSNCQQNQKKIMDFRLKNQNLKSELNKAMRVISRELGQDFNIDQVLNQQNGWKGRQQKIQKLKGRVKQLQDKLSNNGINVSHMSGFTAAQVTNSAFNGTRTSALMAENKRKQFDNLKVQVQALKSQNEILQGKVKSLVSRKIILQNQIKELKADYEKKRELLIEKSNNDDRFIELLKNENEKLKKEQKVVTKVIYKDENTDVSQLKRQIEMLKKKLKNNEPPKLNTSKQEKSTEKEGARVSKDLNSVQGPGAQVPRVLSAEKKKRMQQQYLKSGKYLKKMSSQDQEQLYKNWKSGKVQNNTSKQTN